MNIFYLHESPKICAEMHIDKHCVKMLVEYAQIMSTAHRELDIISKNSLMDVTLYKSTHKNHPTNVWVRQSKENYEWLYEMWVHLHKEFQIRYGKDHMSVVKLKSVLKNPPTNIPDAPFTQPIQAMPDDVKNDDSITAYRDYYIKYKRSFATWKTTTPTWFTEGINNDTAVY